MDMIAEAGRLLLNDVYHQVSHTDSPPIEAIEKLFVGLRHIRLEAPPDEWRRFAQEVALQHPLRDVLHQDPFTRRSFEKPRGYAGDAELLDFIYGNCEEHGSSRHGHAVFQYTTNSPASRAVRYRRDLIAAMIDTLAQERKDPRILSLACGHLREAQLSAAVQEGRIAEYIAIDQDAESLSVVEQNFSALHVRPVQQTIKDFIVDRHLNTLGSFDFVYAAGLYDYLPRPHAQKLTKRMFSLLRPQGKLLVANFLPNIHDVGYMETYMAWQLIYRTREELSDVAALIPEDEMQARRTFIEDNHNIVFLELSRH